MPNSSASPAGRRLPDAVVEDVRLLYADHRDIGEGGKPMHPFAPGDPISLTELKTVIAEELSRQGYAVSARTVHDIVTGKSYTDAPGPVFPTAAMKRAISARRAVDEPVTRTYIELIATEPVGRTGRDGVARVDQVVVARVPLTGVSSFRVVNLTDDQIAGAPVVPVPDRPAKKTKKKGAKK